jgi:AcrR family transcriptional regulator
MGLQERRKREKEHRRRQIMVAAKKLFASKGFNGATVEDIAREAELSPGTLYLYFKNKDELFAALSIKILKYLISRLDSLRKEEGLSPEQRLSRLKDVLYDACAFDSWILIHTFRLQASDTLKHLTEALVSEIQSHTCRIVETMAEILKNGMHAGTFIDSPPHVVASVLWAVFSGAVLYDESQRSASQEGRKMLTLDSAFEIFSRGIKNPTRPSPPTAPSTETAAPPL